MTIKKNTIPKIVAGAISVIIFFIVLGTVVFHRLENWTWIESFYFSVVTFTTVGYGDLAPTHDISRLFTAVYILFSVSTTLTALGFLGETYFKHRIHKNKKDIIMIAAIQNDRGIGYKGNLIHSIQNDMKHFVEKTTGHTVIIGRKNWESIPEKYRPLKNRENIIITRNPNYIEENAIVVHSLKQAIEKSTREKIYIIGGGQIYNMGLKYASELDITHIDADLASDSFFPEFRDIFYLDKDQERLYDEETKLYYQFQTWKRK